MPKLYKVLHLGCRDGPWKNWNKRQKENRKQMKQIKQSVCAWSKAGKYRVFADLERIKPGI